MLSLLQDWKGTINIEVDSEEITDVDITRISPSNFKDKPFHILLLPEQAKTANNAEIQGDSTMSQEVVITVKKYMTQKSNPSFDFMAKWNDDNPMPLRTMVGHKVKETPGMVYMELHGDILQEKTVSCMCCGRKLTNPVSQYFGIGPECGNHNYTSPFDTDEELRQAVNEYKKQLQNTTWSGWIIKSAITREERV